MTIQIPDDWDELTDWIVDNAFDARDAIVNLQRQCVEATAMVRKMLGEMQWMSGSNDFGDGGVAAEGYRNGVMPVMQEAEAFLREDE